MSGKEKKTLYKEIHMNTGDFERGLVALQQLTIPLKLGKKTRVVIDYDPQEPSVTFQYFKVEE